MSCIHLHTSAICPRSWVRTGNLKKVIFFKITSRHKTWARTTSASIQCLSRSPSVKNRRLKPYLPKASPQPFPKQKVCCSGHQRSLNAFTHCSFFPAPLLPSREPASGLARTSKGQGRNLQCAVLHCSMRAHISFSCRPGFKREEPEKTLVSTTTILPSEYWSFSDFFLLSTAFLWMFPL